ncbi:MAG: hypothetical protein ACR2JJ_02375, partial [Sphingomicrobium sp.]
GILALLWNAFGCYDYVMTMSADEAWLSQFTAEQIAYWEGLPGWLTGFWAIGVWGGLAGAILLLMRSRYAVWAFALSVLGIVVSFGYQFLATEMPAGMDEGMMAVMPWIIFAVGIFLLWYSWSMDKKGVLR